MKRCPKCNRTFPDENQKFCTFDGGLLISAGTFDPNVTIRATAADVDTRTQDTTSQAAPTINENINRQHASTSRDLPDLDETIAASAPTAFFPRNTGPTGNATIVDTPSAAAPAWDAVTPSGPVSSSEPLSAPAATAPVPKKKSKLPWILAAVILILLLGGAGLAAVFFVVVKPRLAEFTQRRVQTEKPPATASEQPKVNASPEAKAPEETKAEADTFVPPADAIKFENSRGQLDGKLAEHYVDFSFYYPSGWQTDPKAGVAGASNFARLFKTAKEGEDVYTTENVAVSWYNSNGSYESDVSIFPDRVQALSAQLAKSLPNYRKVSEGPTQVNALKAYDFHFTGVSKDAGQELPYWGRAIFLPSGRENKNGVTIIMLVTAKAGDVKSEEDVGVKGDMPLILESFRFKKD